MHDVKLGAETFARLQAHAIPLVDTIESVINRALDALDREAGVKDLVPDDGVRSFDPSAPPSLSFTTVRSVVVNGRRHPPAETYWNSILEAAVREAAKRGRTPAEIGDLLIVNHVVGPREGGGYRFVEEAGVSVQGQDANAAWRAAFHIADVMKIPIEVTFFWQSSAKAAFPGTVGRMTVR